MNDIDPRAERAAPDGARDEIVAEGIAQVRRYAALSGPFDPVDALRSLDHAARARPMQLTDIAAALSQDCDRSSAEQEGGWLMLGAARHRLLAELADAGTLIPEVARRRRDADDQPTQDLLDAITGDGLFSAESVAAATREDPDPAVLERLSTGLGRAGRVAPQHASLPEIEAALTRLQLVASAQAPRGRGPVANEDEVERVVRWLDIAFEDERTRTLHVEGLHGVGKSALLEEVAARLIGPSDDWIVVRLDFERAGLDVQDTAGLTMEFARQAAAQLPAGAATDLQSARQQAAGMSPGTSPLKGDSPERVPEGLGAALRGALAGSRRRVFLVLDTLEVLRDRGATHPARLFDWIDQLAELTRTPIAVVGAGPADALDGIRARVGERVELPGLDRTGADRLLRNLGVDPDTWDLVRSVAHGDPLTLRLAAETVRHHGIESLRRADRRGGATAAYLYRFLLSRIPDPDLRRLANPGLVVRLVDPEVVRSVVAPQVGLRNLSEARAEELFHALANEHWLVEPDPIARGFLRHRPDIRAQLLGRLYESAPAKSARIDVAAVGWFGARPEPWAAVEAAYHRLQLMRRRPAAPEIDASILAQIDPIAIAELPPAAHDLVQRRLGDRSATFRGAASAPGTPLEPDAARELRSMNERSDWLEGDDLYDRSFAGTTYDPAGPEADVALVFLWRSGRWSEARRLLGRQGGWFRTDPPLDARLETDRLVTICRLEMGAETDFGGLVAAFREDASLREQMAAVAAETTLTSLVGAGLRFALHRAGAEVPPHRMGLDVGGAAAAQWAPTDGPATGPRGLGGGSVAVARTGWDRVLARTGVIDVAGTDEAVVFARRAAVLSPFADLVGTMGRLPDHSFLGGHADGVLERLDDLGNLAPAGSPPWRTDPDRAPALALQTLTDLGLLAELIGSAAYLRRDPDLRLVGIAAERWRRTVAGAWSYGTAKQPPGWDRPVDVSIADRIDALLRRPDPEDAAVAQLEAWAPEHPDGRAVMDLLRERSPATLASASKQIPLRGEHGAAGVLLRRNIPSAFIPSVAVLLGGPRRARRGAWSAPQSPAASPAPISARPARPARSVPGTARSAPSTARRKDTTMTDRRDEEARLDSVRRWLERSPKLREYVQRSAGAAATRGLPSGLVSDEDVERLGRGDELESVLPLDSLEAIVREFGRPPLIVRNGAVDLEDLPDFPAGTDALIKGVERSVRSVGRVEFVNHSMAWGGTGWVVHEEGDSARIVATNRHVAKVVAQRGFDGSGVFMRAPFTGVPYGAEIDFEEEIGSSPGAAAPVRVAAITYLADDAAPDVALMRIEGDALPSALPLADAEADAEGLVALIGYPAYDSRNDAAAQARYFRDQYEIKRFAPGRVMQAIGGGRALTHDCTSLGGNSGSPLISLTDGRVVGLHYAGRYGVANSAVGVDTLRRLVDGERPILSAGFAASREQVATEAASDGVHAPDFFDGRAGYDAAFLGDGLDAPWPGDPAALVPGLAHPSDEDPARPFELRYTHFGVKYHLDRRQPLLTAVNIDGEHPVRIKRGRDKWFRDERIPLDAQLTREDYGDPEIDRGHMVRREDPNWDPAATSPADVTARAQLANDDTFHYTNSALQHSKMNQGKQLWQGLENYLLDSARTEGFKACVFTGPIFRVDDPLLAAGLPVPQEFWKLVVMPAATDDGGTRLHATAYLLSQGELIRDLLEKRSRVEGLEGFVLGAYRTFQVAIADLAEVTGLGLDHYVPFDPLGQSRIGTEAIDSGEPLFVPLDSLDEIVT